MKTKNIKKQAVDLLINNWGQAMVIIFITVVIHIIFTLAESSIYHILKYQGFISDQDFTLLSGNLYMDVVSVFRFIFEFIFVSPVYMGAVWWYIHYVRGENNSVNSVFVCYSNVGIFLKSIALKTVVYAIKLAVLLPVCMCAFIEYKLIDYSLKKGVDDQVTLLLAVCCAVFTGCLICFYVIFSLRYALTDYIFVLDPDMKINKIIKLSVQKMKNNKAYFVKLFISFLWWLPSFLLVFPALFVIPYYMMSLSVMANNILENNYMFKREVLLNGEISAMS